MASFRDIHTNRKIAPRKSLVISNCVREDTKTDWWIIRHGLNALDVVFIISLHQTDHNLATMCHFGRQQASASCRRLLSIVNWIQSFLETQLDLIEMNLWNICRSIDKSMIRCQCWSTTRRRLLNGRIYQIVNVHLDTIYTNTALACIYYWYRDGTIGTSNGKYRPTMRPYCCH